jgi:hypothetical protein
MRRAFDDENDGYDELASELFQALKDEHAFASAHRADPQVI